jgi:hypothetical protein
LKKDFRAAKHKMPSTPGTNDLGERGRDMGGWGSGWRGSKKDVVEDCIVLSIGHIVSEAVILAGGWRRGLFSWRHSDQERPLAVIGFEVSLSCEDGGCVWLEYDRYGEHVHSCISLISTKPYFGGHRWWFKCPATGIRVGKLYLPPGRIQFASRQAHDLTYTSCQQSGQSNRFWRSLARTLGRDEAELRAIFGE